MLLRDHFGAHARWPGWPPVYHTWVCRITQSLNTMMPERYAAAPTARYKSDEFPGPDEYSVQIYDRDEGQRRLVSVVELVMPEHKDRPEHRDTFVGKCAAYLQHQVCLAVVDIVTERSANLHAQLIDKLGGRPVEPSAEGALYATVYRNTMTGDRWGLDVWAYELAVGASLPTLPLWLSATECVPVELDATYTDTGRDLRLW